MTRRSIPLRRTVCRATVLAMLFLPVLAGCSMIPPALNHAYTVISGISYLATSKGPTDHAISMVAREDCSLFRIMRGQPLCVPVTDTTNQPLLVSLSALLKMEPRNLPPEELLIKLPPPVDPRLSLEPGYVPSPDLLITLPPPMDPRDAVFPPVARTD